MPDPESAHPSLVTIAQFRDLSEALLARGMLHSAEIEAFLADENLCGLIGFIPMRLAGCDYKFAKMRLRPLNKSLISRFRKNFAFNEQQDSFEQPRCPSCDSLNIRFQAIDNRMSYASV